VEKVREENYEDIRWGWEVPYHAVPRKQHYWEDIQEGMELPPIPLQLDETEMVKQVSGSQDFNAIHHHFQIAEDEGHGAPFYNGGWHMGWADRILHDLAGPEGWPRMCKLEFRRNNRWNDAIVWEGKITRKYVADNGEHLVDLDFWSYNEREEGRSCIGKATVLLPSRGK